MSSTHTGRDERRLHRRRRALSIGGLALVALVAGAVGGPVTSAHADDPPPEKVLVVSDSSLAALRWYAAAKTALLGADFTLDLESCRRVQGVSCKGRETRIPPTVLTVVKARAAGFDTLVVFAGYNDTTLSVSRGFDRVVKEARARGVKRIVWSTLRINVDYQSPGIVSNNATFVSTNKVLRAKIATGKYPDVVLLDWAGYSASESSWFVTDGVHFTSIGTWAAADYLTRKLAFLDGRACPSPRRTGEDAPSPCPDPDPGPPDVDLVSLYPIDPAALQCYEVGDDRHIECRPDPHANDIHETLRSGMTGAEVKGLQLRLVRKGLLGASLADGKYGRRTLLAIMTAQVRNKLPVTGVADPATRAALGFGCPELSADPAFACPPGGDAPNLWIPVKSGEFSPQVALVQNRLLELGFTKRKADGIYGALTVKMVKAYQATSALPVTGVVDQATALALGFVPVS
jgi:hypothetical protein